MRYHYERKSIISSMYGEIYICDHPVYDRCTLYRMRDRGLAVIQQRYNTDTKETWWEEIDAWLTDDIYLKNGFKGYFDKRAGMCKDGIFPTVTVRQIMWALKMKPLRKERWETIFDRRNI